MKKSLLLVVFSTSLLSQAQTVLQWKNFDDVEFEVVWDSTYEVKVLLPIFGDSIKQFDGKKIRIEGHLIPINPATIGTKDYGYVISATVPNPFQGCYTSDFDASKYIQLEGYEHNLTQNSEFPKTQTLEGILHLNSTNIRDLIYILTEAKIVQEE